MPATLSQSVYADITVTAAALFSAATKAGKTEDSMVTEIAARIANSGGALVDVDVLDGAIFTVAVPCTANIMHVLQALTTAAQAVLDNAGKA